MKIKRHANLESELDRKLVYIKDRQKIRNIKGKDFDTSSLDVLITQGTLNNNEWAFLLGVKDKLAGDPPKHVVRDYSLSGFEEGYNLGYESV